MPSSQSPSITDLRAAIASTEARSAAGAVAFGVAVLDDALAAGGLARAAVHDASAASPELADAAATTLFTAGVAGRAAEAARQVLWIATRADLYAPGLAQAGLTADRVVYAEARNDAEALALAEDGLADGVPGCVVVEVVRAPMTSTRRLQLACERSRTPVLLLRRWRRRGVCPLSEPSAAATRWRIGTAPSAPLAVPGLGRARWSVELVRQRGGEPFSLVLEACDAQGSLALPAAAADRAPAQERAPAVRAA